MHVQTTPFVKITSEHLDVALSPGIEVKSIKHRAHSHGIRGPFKALSRTTCETRFTGAPVRGAVPGQEPLPSEEGNTRRATQLTHSMALMMPTLCSFLFPARAS